MPGNGTTVTGGGQEEGSGYQIADHFVLTAGHVIYDWRNFGHFPIDIAAGGNNVVLDFRGYSQAFSSLISGWETLWPVQNSDNHTLTMHEIEGHPSLAASDSVVILQGNDDIGPGDDGLVVFLDRDDLEHTDSANFLGSATRVVRSDKSGTNSGHITEVDPSAFFTSATAITYPWSLPGGTIIPGTFKYSNDSVGGDSGGAYLLKLEDKEFVIGTHFANVGSSSSSALGTYFSYEEWREINRIVIDSQTGNVTDHEPTNLIVGKNTADGTDTQDGSFRPDVILARGGDDRFNDGDTPASAVYADDQIFGGAGNDILAAGRGSDLLHGGDYRAYGGTRTALADDGHDTVSYAGQNGSVTIEIHEVAGGEEQDLDHSVFVLTNGDKVAGTDESCADTLISIEEITGSSFKDEVTIASLTVASLADANGLGGLARIDLGGETAPTGDTGAPGDLINLSAMTEGVKVDLASGRVELKSNSSAGLTIVNAERVRGGDGEDEIIGNAAGNELVGGASSDTFKGSAGNDQIWGDAGEGEPALEGADTVDYSASTSPITVEFDGSGATPSITVSAFGGTDTLHGIEIVKGTSGRDIFNLTGTIGDGVSITFDANGGQGGSVSDQVNGAHLSEGMRLTNTNGGGDVTTGGSGVIHFIHFYSDIVGSAFDDVISDSSTGNKNIDAGGGDDEVTVSGGSAVLVGGAGADVLIAGAGNDTLYSNTAASSLDEAPDVLTGGAGDDTFYVGDGDRITDIDANDVISIGGFRLRGGTQVEAGSSTYVGEDGTTYTFPSGSSSATATTPDGQSVTFDGFQNGDAGIRLNLRDPDSPEEPYIPGRGGPGIGYASGTVCIHPFIVDLDGDGIELTSLKDSSAFFDFDANSYAELTAWVSGGDGLLAIDLNDNGLIDDHSELFEAAQAIGFAALAPYDTDQDGRLTASDGGFSQLRVWIDADESGFTNHGELITLADAGIAEISLSPVALNLEVEGNSVTAAAAVTMTGGATTSMYEVWFETNPHFSRYTGTDWLLDELSDFDVPRFHGHGTLPDLLIACARDPILQAMVFDLLEPAAHDIGTSAGFAAFRSEVEQVLLRWSRADGVDPASAGAGVNAQHLAFWEAFFGSEYNVSSADHHDKQLEPAYQHFVDNYTIRFLTERDDNPLPISMDASNEQLVGDLDEILAAIETLRPADPAAQAAFDGWARTMVRIYVFDIDSSLSTVGAWIRGATSATAGSTDTLVEGTAGNDSLNGGNGDDVLVGGAGNDTIHGNDGYDAIQGGLGNDLLYGGEGTDGYIYHLGDGNDVITDHRYTAVDRILFGAGITPDNVRLVGNASDYNDVVITFLGTAGSITLSQKATGEDDGVHEIWFSDGTIWRETDILEAFISGQATAGNDTVNGTYRGDRIDGGLGNDILRGGLGNDTYLFGRGSGQDIVRDSVAIGHRGGTDTVELGADIATGDVTIVQSGYDLILKINGSTDQLTLDDTMDNDGAYERIEQVRFADGTVWTHADLFARVMANNGGNDTFYGGPETETISGGAGNDTLAGNEGSDILDGGTGNDVLQGGWGNDTYIFGRGYGQDIVRDPIDVGNRGGTETILLAADITPADITVVWSGVDIILKINGSVDQITLDDTMDNDGDYDRIEQVSFADGTVWTHADLLAQATLANTGNDTFHGGPESETISGGAGNDTLVGNHGNDVLDGGIGNDLLQGGLGDDTYLFGRGYGQDIVRDPIAMGNRAGADIVQLGNNIVTSDVTVVWSGVDLILKINGTTDQLTLDDTMDNDGNYDRIEQVRFADGTTWSHQDLLAQAMLGNGGNDTFSGGPESETISGGAGNDALVGNMGNDVLDGGAGNDLLRGGGGNDTFLFGRGYGQDVVNDNVAVGNRGGTDTIILGADITTADVTVAQGDSSRDLVIKINGTTDQITVDDGIVDSLLRVEELRFADGTVWNYTKLFELSAAATDGPDTFSGDSTDNSMFGGAGNDTLTGNGGNDRLDGGTGNDLLRGGVGNDTYVFGRGYGQDIARDSIATGNRAGTDTVELADDLTTADISVVWSGVDLIIKINGTTDQLLLDDTMDNDDAYERIEQVRFADGTIWSHVDLLTQAMLNSAGNDTFSGGPESETISGGAGNDTLLGNEGSDILRGGAGNDLLQGGWGNDTYLFGRGDGQDTIRDTITTGNRGGTETVEFDADIATGDITVVWSGVDLILKINGTTDQLLLDDTMDNDGQYERIEQVRFGDGTVWSHADLLTQAMLNSAGNNSFSGGPESETISGGAGNDTLLGNEGNDVLDGGSGNDLLQGGWGHDTYIFGRGYGQDIVRDPIAVGNRGGTQIVLLAPDIATSDITVVQSGYDLILKINGTTDQLTLDDTMDNDGQYERVSEVHFSDGTIWTHAELFARAMLNNGGADTFYGGPDNDTMRGGAGNDTLYGLAGNDTFEVGANEGFDAIDGSSGSDTIAATANDVAIGLRSITGIEAITGGGFTGVTVKGSESAEVLAFSAVTLTGIDRIDGAGGNDALTGSIAADVLWGGAGDDILKGGTGNDSLDGGVGTDKAQFAGTRSTYTITTSGGSISVVDDAAATDGDDGTDTLAAVEQAQFKDQTISLAMPIILDLDGDGVALLDAGRSRARFDWDGDGTRDRTGWMGPGDGMLVYDRNQDGRVSGASELSFVNDKPGAKSDLDGLSALDSDGDGYLSGGDDAWLDFMIWADADLDGRVDRGELLTLHDSGVASISLMGTATEQSWDWDTNIIVNQGRFTRTDGSSGAFADAALSYAPEHAASSDTILFGASLPAMRLAGVLEDFEPGNRLGDQLWAATSEGRAADPRSHHADFFIP